MNVEMERRRKRHRCIHKEDRISELGDDILALIVSKLSLQEAMGSSLLSSRWRHLSAHITHLRLCQFSPKSKPSQETIDKWFDFVLAKQVEVLSIITEGFDYSLTLFDLIGKKVEQPALNFLKELSLSWVDVDDGEFEVLLTICPLVESLSIDFSQNLRNVKIVDHLLRLKQLSLCRLKLQSLEIGNAMNLVCFKCYLSRIDNLAKLYNLPKLIEFGTDYSREAGGSLLFRILSTTPSYILHQLRVLKASTRAKKFWKQDDMLPDLINIQHLELTIHMSDEHRCTYILIPLIGASPSLEKLDIKFVWRFSRFKFEREIRQFRYDAYGRNKELFKSKLIKKLHIWGYLGCEEERVLVMCIIKNYGVEELVVEVCDETQEMRSWATARACHHFSTLNKITII